MKMRYRGAVEAPALHRLKQRGRSGLGSHAGLGRTQRQRFRRRRRSL